MPRTADQIANLDAELDALSTPTTAEVLVHSQDYDTEVVAASAAARAINGGGGGGSSPAVTMPNASDPGAAAHPINGRMYVPGMLSNDSELYWIADMDWMAAVPFLVPTVATAAMLNLSTGEAGKKARCAIYEADDDFQPTSLLWESAEVDITGDLVTYTLIRMPFPGPITFSGNYLFATNADSVTPTTAYPEGFQIPGWVYQTDVGMTLLKAIYRPRTYGAFPDPGDPWLFADSFVDDAFGTFGYHIVPFGLEIP